MRPRVLTAHDVLPREPRPGQLEAPAAALRADRRRRRALAARRGAPARRLGVDPSERVHVIPHGAFDHLAALEPRPLPPELAEVEGPVVLFFGLLRPYKGVDLLLEAWRGIEGRRAVGRRACRAWRSSRCARAAPRRRALRAALRRPTARSRRCFRRADLVVLPYREIDQSGVLFTALAFGTPFVQRVGGFAEVADHGAGDVVAPADPAALHDALPP